MVDRRSLLKAGIAGLGGSALVGTANATTSWRLLEIKNTGDRKQRVTVVVDGRARHGPEASRDEDDIETRDGRTVIRAVLDPTAVDSFWVDGDIRRVDWTGSKPRIRLGGEEIDPADYRDGHDDKDDDRDGTPSRVLFVATGDDLEAVLRVSGRLWTGRDSDRDHDRREIRVRLDRGELRRVYYTGNIRELRTADGEMNVYITQRD